MDHTAFQQLFRNYLAQIQLKNPAYSIRSFAKRAGIGFGTASQVLSGRRTLSSKSVLKVLERLTVTPAERARVLKQLPKKLSYEYSELEADHYFILSEWYYLAILSMVRTQDFKSTPTYISERLGISVSVAEKAVERLLRVKLLQLKNKRLVRTKVAIQSSDGVLNLAIRKSHFQSLERVKAALEEHPFESFDVSSLTFAFTPKDLSLARKRIKQFQDEFADEFSTSKHASEVYRLAVQLISLTIPKDKI